MSSKSTPTIQELMAFVLAQKEAEKEIERKRQCLLEGTPYTAETAETARDGPRKSSRKAPKSTKFDDPYPPVKSALAQAVANRRATKRTISVEDIKQMCALRFASVEKQPTSNEELKKVGPVNGLPEKKNDDDDERPVEAEMEGEQENKMTVPVAKDPTVPARQSGRRRKARTPFEASN